MAKIPIPNAAKQFIRTIFTLIVRVSIYQVFMMLGVERTSPAIASAMPNLGPGLIIIISACLRY